MRGEHEVVVHDPTLVRLISKDLAAILLTGIPSGIVPGFQNYTGATQADLLRLNLAIAPSASPSPYGILGGDLAGFPNGRRVSDDVVAIELRAVAGAVLPLVDTTYTADGAASVLVDGTSNTNSPLLDHFPYLGTPVGGYQSMPGTPARDCDDHDRTARAHGPDRRAGGQPGREPVRRPGAGAPRHRG